LREVAVVSLFRRLRASAVLGYLVFLLFSIGLELSVERLVGLRRYVFGLGAAQVVGTQAEPVVGGGLQHRGNSRRVCSRQRAYSSALQSVRS
jgi:Kef-type K+ transport system membrane component KefB